jgi:predicted amidophosphoribosyltransferase
MLVPIPDSRCVCDSDESRTRALADVIAARLSSCRVTDCLRFDTDVRSAHCAQGARDARSLYHHLRLVGAVSRDTSHVLVDDVVTTGGHMAAAAAALRAAGGRVRIGICAASADRTPAADPFARVLRVIPDYLPLASSSGSDR